MDPLRIVIVDDHPLFRYGVRVFLDATPEIEVVGEATSGEEGLALSERLQPDVVLMDLQMPGMNGIEAIRRLVHESPQIRILVLTMFEDDASVFMAMRAGARGYVLKDAEKADLLRAIQAVGRGEAIFSPAVAGRVIDFLTTGRPSGAKDIFPALTEREREILDLIAQGLANPEIARTLALSPKTVGNYVGSIFAKLQVADRAHAIIRARDAGLGQTGPVDSSG